MWRLEIRPRDRIHLKKTDSFPVFRGEIGIVSKTPKQAGDETENFSGDETDCFPRNDTDEKIRKHRANNSDEKASSHKEREHPTVAKNDFHQTTAHADTGHLKTSLKDPMTFVRLVNTVSLPPQAMNSEGTSTTLTLQIVQENNRDIQPFSAIPLQQRAPPTPVNFESQFFQKFYKGMKRLELVKRTLCRK